MKIDYVMKLGGSLLYDLDKTRQLLKRIENSENNNVVYTVGSGYLGEVYKKWVRDDNGISVPYENSIKIWSDIQSTNANVIAGLNSRFVVCDNEEEIAKTLKQGKRPILDARGFHEEFKDLKYQTTDVRSARLCKMLNCTNLVIVTDVDGIYSGDPKVEVKSRKLKKINVRELAKMGRTSVDNGLAELLIEYGITGYVVGIENLLKSKDILKREVLKEGTVIEH